MAKPTLPQGTRDFGPDIVRKRNFILHTIRSVFELYGFQPLETPAMENLETLMGKYGEEGDKLIFRILNNGLDNPDRLEQVKTDFEQVLAGKNSRGITERALRYDLTIPFARYVAMNQGQLVFPFKRFQIQPVWRADRPQKGRYREFYQCDADVVGSNSLKNELDFVGIYHQVLTSLGITGYELRINSRKILAALAVSCGGPEKLTDITIAIDKLDKIGLDKVKEELLVKGLTGSQVDNIAAFLAIGGTNEEKMTRASQLLGQFEDGKKGLEELTFILHNLTPGQQRASVLIDFTLARGLNYYTGIIFEAKAPAGIKMGSIGGGGRYDDLTGLFGVPGIPGVGISFGVDRIYDVMEEMAVFPDTINISTQIMFLNPASNESIAVDTLAETLRAKGIRTEVYHDQHKIDKQYKYAEKKNIPFVVTIGEAETQQQACKIKNIKTGITQIISWHELGNFNFDQV